MSEEGVAGLRDAGSSTSPSQTNPVATGFAFEPESRGDALKEGGALPESEVSGPAAVVGVEAHTAAKGPAQEADIVGAGVGVAEKAAPAACEDNAQGGGTSGEIETAAGGSELADDVAPKTDSTAGHEAMLDAPCLGDDAAASSSVKPDPAEPPPNAEPQRPIDERRRIWRPRHNKCSDETDSDAAWYRHKRHVLVFTYSGKPVYTRYGSEEGLVSTTGALSAIVSKMQAFFVSGAIGEAQDSLRYMVTGGHIFVFVERGPLWLVCISCCGDSYPDLVRMLDRVHCQIITILTTGIERTLASRPNYDMRSLLGGTDCVVNNMIRWGSQDLQVDGFEPLPLPPAHRNSAVEALRAARVPNVLCAFLLAGHRFLAIVTNRQYKVHAVDLQTLVNLIMSSASLRTSESWTPVCLVHLNDKAFAYAYISFVEGIDVGVVFLSTASDGDQFYAISQQAAIIKQTLQKSGCLDAVGVAMEHCPIDFRKSAAADGVARVDRSGRRSLLASFPQSQWKLLEATIHAAYFVPSLQQFFSSAIAAPHQTRRRTKMLFRTYGHCRQLLQNAKQPCQICVATDHECFYAFLAAEFHLYLAVPRGTSTRVIGQLYQWFKSQEAHIFLGNIPTW
mmetsp:Transcript_39057/g.107605  ORF Transcript_39057/g.107605 Transcript_39057/m.107605 type:complete len:620 (+) Transcript_39057:230-2089(+)